MNIILNMPTETGEIQQNIARWQWDRIKHQIKNADIDGAQKQAIYESLVAKSVKSLGINI